MQQRRIGRIGVAGLLIFMVLVYSLYGCASMPRGSGTAIGGISGGTIGALIGGLAGGEKGALIGAGAGVLAGALIGYAIESRQIKDYQTTKQEQGYEPSEGEVVRITDFSVKPAVVSPGTQLAFQSTYYIMTPHPDQEVPITEVRILKGLDPQTQQYRELGRTPARQIMVKPGTRQADGTIPIVQDAREGSYQIAFEVGRDGTRDQKELPVTVTKNQALLHASGSKVAHITEPPKASTTARSALGASKQPPPSGSAATSPAKRRYFVASNVSGEGNLRDGPGTSYGIVATIQRGERFPIIESTASPPWHKIRLEDGRAAWVNANLGVVE